VAFLRSLEGTHTCQNYDGDDDDDDDDNDMMMCEMLLHHVQQSDLLKYRAD
jgi:hypothetical protein